MRPLKGAVALCLLLLLAPLLASAAAQAGVSLPDFPLDKVEAGLEGYGLTAGPGGQVQRFEVEVLAVQHDAGPGFPLVLVRASGPLIDAAGGVAAGMSGSPVYLQRGGRDALLGAVGFVFPEADHELALVTPIAAMRDRRVASGASLHVAGLGSAVPVSTPVLMAGASPRAATLLGELFGSAPTVPVVAPRGAQGGSDAAGEAPPPELVPGSAIAVELISGDLQLAALGTLTAVEGRSLLALGHPLFGYGTISYGLAAATVTAIVPSAVVPFKLANLVPGTLGAVTLDTPAALIGATGTTPRTVGLDLVVTASGAEERYSLRLADDERLYPLLTAVATLDAADRVLRATGPGRAELAWEIALADGERVNVVEQVASEDDVGMAAARLAGGPLSILATNRFADPRVEHVSLSVAFFRDPGSADVARLVLESTEHFAGGHAVVHVRLQPYRAEAVVRTFSVPLPVDLSGEVILLVRGGDVPRDVEKAPEEGGEVDEPRTFAEMLDALRQQVQASELVFESVDQHGDVRRLLRVPLPWVVIGSQDLRVTIEPVEGDATAPEAENPEGGEEDPE